MKSKCVLVPPETELGRGVGEMPCGGPGRASLARGVSAGPGRSAVCCLGGLPLPPASAPTSPGCVEKDIRLCVCRGSWSFEDWGPPRNSEKVVVQERGRDGENGAEGFDPIPTAHVRWWDFTPEPSAGRRTTEANECVAAPLGPPGTGESVSSVTGLILGTS